MTEPKSLRIPKPFWFGIVAVPMGVLWVVLAVWLPYHREQIAIREIERLGGMGIPLSVGPDWLQKMVLPKYFGRINSVSLIDLDITDEELKSLCVRHLSGLKKLEMLWIQNTQIGDESLKHLRGLANLEGLLLRDTQISDEGLKHLSGLTNLKSLNLTNTQVTDEGVKELQKALPDCNIFY